MVWNLTGLEKYPSIKPNTHSIGTYVLRKNYYFVLKLLCYTVNGNQFGNILKDLKIRAPELYTFSIGF